MRSAEIVIIPLLLDVTQGFAQSEVRGRVISTSGSPLAEVKIQNDPWKEITTNKNGEFYIMDPWPLLRFSLPGSRPVTKRLDEIVAGGDVVLKPDSSALWTPPKICSRSGRKGCSFGSLDVVPDSNENEGIPI